MDCVHTGSFTHSFCRVGGLEWTVTVGHLHTSSVYFVYSNGEIDSSREETRWCRCDEGQRDEV